jgi:hypothetical protein
MQTRLWLTSQAERLVKMRALLEKELNKFTHVSAVQQGYSRHYRLPSDCFASPLNPINPKYSSRGQMNLRRLIEEVCHSGRGGGRIVGDITCRVPCERVFPVSVKVTTKHLHVL